MGDLQCSVKSTLGENIVEVIQSLIIVYDGPEDSEHDAVVNVSTSAQMAFVKPEGFQPQHCQPDQQRTSIEFFPYFEVSGLSQNMI